MHGNTPAEGNRNRVTGGSKSHKSFISVTVMQWLVKVVKASFNEANIPKGGTCLSAFLVIRNGSSLLAGKMSEPEIWAEKFLVRREYADQLVKSGGWVIPASHLRYGESLGEAAQRLLRDMLGIKEAYYSLIDVQSHVTEDPKDPDAAHWDLCFVFDTKISGRPTKPKWFSVLEFISLENLRPFDFERGHGDILQQLGLIK